MVGYPYPKYLNAIMEVDQSAAVLIASVRKARELGVPEDRWVFLHGCADASDLWYPLERQDYHSSPALVLTGERALEMAGITLDDLGVIDLYSCFPSAVRIGAEEIGLPLDDPRTHHHRRASLLRRTWQQLCAARDRRDGDAAEGTAWGLWLVHRKRLVQPKQSVRIYSTRPVTGKWEREPPSVIQARSMRCRIRRSSTDRRAGR